MGYGLPAAIAATMAEPGRRAVAFAGDGCFLMTGQELATAVQYALPIVVIVADNGMYGTIRMHQQRRYPGRPCATGLVNPDFAAMARSFGAHGETVERNGDFADALRRCLEIAGPSLIHLKVAPEAIAPRQTLN
jgi:acetolactate synthase-1/2/3 large subunit